MEKKLNIRPYARLLTMLGEQLIKNEQIALAELIKNHEIDRRYLNSPSIVFILHITS